MRNSFWVLVLAFGMVARLAASAEPYHETSETLDYRCLFNHELLIVCHRPMNPQSIGGFVEKLEPTDVDAVMCCPTMWRANLFPSKIDTVWTTYDPDAEPSKFRSFDRAMTYIHGGGDPVKDTLEACRKSGKDFFISYRMNDHHYVTDLSWPTHNFIWRDHPEYWLGDSDTSPYSRTKDNVRLLDYMLPEVRGYYFSIIEELCMNYDVDGLELDFQRFPRFFHNDEMQEGAKVMTAFIGRLKDMLNRLGKERGKTLRICVRVPETPAKCTAAGLDVFAWDALGLVDMLNVSSFYLHTMELGIEEFKVGATHAKVYGEMNYVSYQNKEKKRRYNTFEIYRASALNLFHRGADGLSLFNYDYVPGKYRAAMTEGLKKITDVEYLKTTSKNYIVYPGFGTFAAKDEKTLDLIIPDDTALGAFKRALLRVETKEPCTDLDIVVWLNGKRLTPCAHEDTELFPPVERNPAYAVREALKFYEVPLEFLAQGPNEVSIKNLDKATMSCMLFSMELALYR
jgi:hypothetical protein